MEFLELAKERYSCRKLTDRKVEKELLDKIIEAAIAAPTAVNKQAFKIWVLESEEAKQNISQVTRFTFGAQTYLLVGYKSEDAWTRKYDQRNFADVDAAIVATHMMMEIQDLGLATTWVGHFNAPLLKELYPEMREYGLIALFPVGYAEQSEEGMPSVRHSERKTKEELVKVL